MSRTYAPTASTISPVSYSTSTAIPATRPAASGRLLQASRNAPKPSAAAGTWPKLAIANPDATVPRANVTSDAPPHPGASPSATRPTMNTQSMNATPTSASLTAHSCARPTPSQSSQLGSRTIWAGTIAISEKPGALSE